MADTAISDILAFTLGDDGDAILVSRPNMDLLSYTMA